MPAPRPGGSRVKTPTPTQFGWLLLQGKNMNNILLLDCHLTDANGSVLGSFFTPELVATAGKVTAAGVLSPSQIRAAHGLTPREYEQIEKQVLKAKVLDALFSWPQGPRYDILGYRWATCR
jgi:hypothetical protein